MAGGTYDIITVGGGLGGVTLHSMRRAEGGFSQKSRPER
jgi:hypothetical protein